MKTMTIGEVARRAGMRESAIRYYESVGVLPRAPRVAGRRVYDASVFKRLRAVAAARRLGFSLADIRELLGGDGRLSARWRSLSAARWKEAESLLDVLSTFRYAMALGRRCDCTDLDDCVLTNRA